MYTTSNTILEVIEKPKWRMRLRDAATGRVLSTRAEHDNDELVNAYFKKGKSFIHKAYVAYINHKGKSAMRKNPSAKSYEYELEEIIDKFGLQRTVEALAEICHLKAEHIEENWQDNYMARAWRKAAGSVYRCSQSDAVFNIGDIR